MKINIIPAEKLREYQAPTAQKLAQRVQNTFKRLHLHDGQRFVDVPLYLENDTMVNEVTDAIKTADAEYSVQVVNTEEEQYCSRVLRISWYPENNE